MNSRTWRRVSEKLRRSRHVITENLGLAVAIGATTIALWSAKVQRDAMQLDERPYLKVSFEKIQASMGEPPEDREITGYEATVKVAATGKTPAFNIDASGACLPSHYRKENDSIEGMTWRLWPFLFDETQNVNCFFDHGFPDNNLPRNITFELSVTYDDIFKNHHTTTYCQIIIPDRGKAEPGTGPAHAIECPGFKFTMD